jgi:hypothetical protein
MGQASGSSLFAWEHTNHHFTDIGLLVAPFLRPPSAVSPTLVMDRADRPHYPEDGRVSYRGSGDGASRSTMERVEGGRRTGFAALARIPFDPSMKLGRRLVLGPKQTGGELEAPLRLDVSKEGGHCAALRAADRSIKTWGMLEGTSGFLDRLILIPPATGTRAKLLLGCVYGPANCRR